MEFRLILMVLGMLFASFFFTRIFTQHLSSCLCQFASCGHAEHKIIGVAARKSTLPGVQSGRPRLSIMTLSSGRGIVRTRNRVRWKALENVRILSMGFVGVASSGREVYEIQVLQL